MLVLILATSLVSLIPSPPRVINIKFLLRPHTRENITLYRTKNLAFHSLLTWKMIILLILTTSPIHSHLNCWQNLGLKGLKGRENLRFANATYVWFPREHQPETSDLKRKMKERRGKGFMPLSQWGLCKNCSVLDSYPTITSNQMTAQHRKVRRQKPLELNWIYGTNCCLWIRVLFERVTEYLTIPRQKPAGFQERGGRPEAPPESLWRKPCPSQWNR